MLNAIELKNYKAFKNAKLEVKPITILLGSNSCGKSSILQTFLLLAQTYGNSGPTLKVNGALASLGQPANLLHKRQLGSTLEISLHVDALDFIQFDKLKGLSLELLQAFSDCVSHIKSEKIKVSRQCHNAIEEIKKYDEVHRKQASNHTVIKLLPSYIALGKEAKRLSENDDKGENNRSILESESEPSSVTISIPNLVNDNSLISRPSDLQQCIDVAEAVVSMLIKPKVKKVTYTFFLSRSTSQLEIASINLSDGKKSILNFSRKTISSNENITITSDYFNQKFLAKYKRELRNTLIFDGLTAQIVDEVRRKKVGNHAFAMIFGGILCAVTQKIAANFTSSTVKHVSPLRAFPKRYYYSEYSSGESLDTRNGESLAETLKRKSGIREQINKWLTKFGMSVDVHDVRDLIKSIRIRQNGMDMDLTDVGFGISQILPVIAQGFLSNKDTVTLIEQPEIHLHPKMQAELADLFIDMVKSNNGRLIIETHSEYLLKRLRRRIAEGRISASDVAIHLVHGRSGSRTHSRLEKVAIGARGAFVWPKDFAAIDLVDTIEFARLQSRPALENTDSESK